MKRAESDSEGKKTKPLLSRSSDTPTLKKIRSQSYLDLPIERPFFLQVGVVAVVALIVIVVIVIVIFIVVLQVVRVTAALAALAGAGRGRTRFAVAVAGDVQSLLAEFLHRRMKTMRLAVHLISEFELSPVLGDLKE